MPIRVACPSCDTVLTAPDTSAGKVATCPKCRQPMTLPAAPPVSRARVVRSSAPAGRPDPVDDDDDRPRGRRPSRREEEDDEDVDEKPKRRKKKRKAKSVPPVVIVVGLLMIGTMIAGGAAVAFFALNGTDKPNTVSGNPTDRSEPARDGGVIGSVSKAVLGDGWTTVTGPDGLFTAQFPGGAPVHQTVDMDQPRKYTPPTTALQSKEPVLKGESWVRDENGRQYMVMYSAFPPNTAHVLTPELFANTTIPFNPTIQVMVDEKITVDGKIGRSVAFRARGKTEIYRIFGLGNGRVLRVSVSGDLSLERTDPKVVSFFEKIRLKN